MKDKGGKRKVEDEGMVLSPREEAGRRLKHREAQRGRDVAVRGRPPARNLCTTGTIQGSS